MRQPSGTKLRIVKNNVFDILQAQARAGDEIAIELLEQRRTAEKTPAKLVKPPRYRQHKGA
jgi:hypothetical protein